MGDKGPSFNMDLLKLKCEMRLLNLSQTFYLELNSEEFLSGIVTFPMTFSAQSIVVFDIICYAD